MSKSTIYALLPVLLALLALAASGCNTTGFPTAVNPPGPSVPPLSPTNVNLVFVVTPDLSNNFGDINADTANLSNQGLQRALKLGAWLRYGLLSQANPRKVYALEPATRLQTAGNYPDMVPLETIEQYALLCRWGEDIPPAVAADSFPINVAYSAASLPAGAAAPPSYYPYCQGLDFADKDGGNEALVQGILLQKQGGYYVFALPFDTFKTLLNNLKTANSYDYVVPAAAGGPGRVYALVARARGQVTLVSYDTQLQVSAAYPPVTPPWQDSPVAQQLPVIVEPAKSAGYTPPGDINTSETVYFVRHGEAHPASGYDDGNLVLPGIWRGLYLPTALATKITTPDFVYAVDPAQVTSGSAASTDPTITNYCYIRTSLTVAEYAIAKGIPLKVPTGFFSSDPGAWSPESQAPCTKAAAKFFFTGGQFSHRTLLIAWEHYHIPWVVQQLVNLYFPDKSQAPQVPVTPWPSGDYDTIWKITLDDHGVPVISNQQTEGISTSALPAAAPGLSF